MDLNQTDIEQKKKKRKGWPVVIIFAAVVILVAACKNYVSFLEGQLFEERKSHIVEFTDKASEIVDSVISSSWQQVYACEYILKYKSPQTEADLLDVLASTSDFIDRNRSIVLAINENGGYYASDQATARWQQTELLRKSQDRQQQLVSEIPHKAGQSYFLFMERLNEPLVFAGGGERITHLVVAEDIEAMRGKISVKGFGEQCYTYLMNEHGRRLYRYTYANNFIEGYNILNAFKDYSIVHGGTYEEFVQKIGQGENTALEFVFTGEDGGKQRWFVANASIATENWQILLFVPSKVLGANSNLLLERTIIFFVLVFVVILALTAIMILVTISAMADKQLVLQKEQANRLLKVAADEANSANRAKSDFLSHMSHDIRTPINGIMGMTDIALKHLDNREKVLDCLNKISGSSYHLLGLINDVLDMSRIESGKTKANYAEFDIRTCIENCASIISGQLTTRDIGLVLEVEPFEHPFVRGDELHLRQVFINILGNSVKFTPDGGNIYFSAKEAEHTQERALFRFELADTGIGMKEEFLPRLFEAFSQEDDGSRTAYKGTGLGMAITKKFVELMGGTIAVKSQLNVGTEFTIELWMDIDHEAKTKQTQESARISLAGMKALLVEDIELNMEIAQCILEENGVEVTQAFNGKEAVDIFAGRPAGAFDVILMDIMMPVMDGLAATKAIRGMCHPDAKSVVIIAMTANAYEEDIKKSLEAGMDAHLSKPIDAGLLLRTLAGFYSPCDQQARLGLDGIRVLLVDDVELNLEIAKELLEDWGVDAETAENGNQAVELFESHPAGTFHAILMDVHMPVMDGLAATRMIRQMERADAKGIPILAMTADVDEDAIQKTADAGMDGYLEKPFDAEAMRKELLRVCGRGF